jgi:subtilisin family serine protease
MKNHIVFTFLFLALFSFQKQFFAQSKFYYSQNEKIFLSTSSESIIIKFKDEIGVNDINTFINTKEYLKDSEQLPQNIAQHFYKLIFQPNADIPKLIKELKSDSRIEFVDNVYKINDLEAIPFYRFLIRFKPEVTEEQIEALNIKHHVEIEKTGNVVNDYYKLRITAYSDLNVVDMAKLYYETLPAVWSHPDFIIPIELQSPNDTYFNNQYYLHNTGQTGGLNDADIDALEAWNITTGSPSVIVAVIDEGGTSHEDLPAERIVNGYDFYWDDSNPYPEGNQNHGMACAGIIAATQNNSAGITGIASNCKVMNIKIANQLGEFPQEVSRLADAINYAWQNGADIISNSWGTKEPDNPNLIPVIVDAINNALTKGRGDGDMIAETGIDKGCVVVFAAGNYANRAQEYYHYVIFPASVPGVIAVGATDKSNNIKNYSPRDNDLAVVAPSGDLAVYVTGSLKLNGDIWSMDIPGVSGWNPGNNGYGYLVQYTWDPPGGDANPPGNYTAHFGGTSAACPQVSGVAALILSVDTNLTQSQVADIIKKSADDMGASGYDTDFGYGRLNAYQALLLALAYSNKSLNQTATSSNNGRRLVKDGSDNYHLVFASGGEIFYHKTTNGGSSWLTPIRLSSGNDSNNYPSIAFGSGNQIMVVWERQTGTTTHDIYFSMSTDGGNTWPSNYKYILAASVTSTNEAQVITMNQSNQRKTVVYTSSSGLTAKTTTTTNPTSTSWTTQQITTSSNDFDPTIASCGNSTYIILSYRSTTDNHVYFRYQSSNGTWSDYTRLSTMIPGQSLNVSPTICGMPTDGSVHLAWTRYSYSGGYPTSPKTYYTKNTSANGTWPYQYWQVSTWDEVTPTITALTSNKIDLIFQATNNGLYKQRFNGSSWNSPSLVAYPTSKYPSVSIGGTEAKYVYTNGSLSPYTVQLSSEVLTKENNFENAEKYYSRSVALIEFEGSFVEYILHDIKVSKEDKTESLTNLIPSILEDKSLSSIDAFDVQSSEYFILDKDAKEIVVDYNINSMNSEKVVNDITKPVYLVVKIIDENGKQLNTANKLIDITQKNETFSKQSITLPIVGITGNVKVKTYLEGLEVNKEAIVSLGHLYDYSSFSTEKENVAIEVKTETAPSSYSLSNYPNPFNPSTTINFSLPKESKVSLKIYDVLGKLIETVIENEVKSPGNYQVTFNSNNLPSGVYFYTLTSGDFMQTRKMILTK